MAKKSETFSAYQKFEAMMCKT
jgi:hypothetical protein